MTSAKLRNTVRCLPPEAAGDDRQQRRARAAAAEDAELAVELEHQAAVDREIRRALDTFAMPDGLAGEVAELGRHLRERRTHFRASMAGLLAIGAAVIVLLWIGIGFFARHVRDFPGRDEATELAQQSANLTPEQFQAIRTTLGNLGDWLLSKGFDRYRVPAGFEDISVEATALIENKGSQAAVIVTGTPPAVCLVFPATPLGIRVEPEEVWQYFDIPPDGDAGPLAAAIQESRGICFLVVLSGTTDDARKFVEARARPPKS